MVQMQRTFLTLLITSSILVLNGCHSGDNNTVIGNGRSALVTVTDYAGNRLPDVVVVLGDSNGTMKASGVTNANGQYEFPDAPANATITAATSTLMTGATATTYRFAVGYDVNDQVGLTLGRPPVRPRSDASIGTIILNVTNTVAGITKNSVYAKNLLSSVALITQETLTVRAGDLQSDGKLSIVVTGNDSNDNPVGYGSLLNQTFTSGMSVDISVDQPMSYVQYHVANIPTAVLYLVPSITGTNLGIPFGYNPYTLATGATSTTINMPYIPGTGDQYTYGLSATLNVNKSGTDDSYQSFVFRGVSGVPPQDQFFDFNEALAVPSNLSVSGATTATPTFSWHALDPGVTYLRVTANILQSNGSSLSIFINNVSATRTSITFPELPESLADFRPTRVDQLLVDISADTGTLYRSSGSSYTCP